MSNVVRSSVRKISQATNKSIRNSHFLVKECELLKRQPIPGIATWYSTELNENKSVVKSIHLMRTVDGKTITLENEEILNIGSRDSLRKLVMDCLNN